MSSTGLRKTPTRAGFAAGLLFFVLMLVLTPLSFSFLLGRIQESPVFALSYITIDSLSEHVSQKEAVSLISQKAGGQNLAALKLKPLYEELLRHPWIARVKLKKRYPNLLELSIVEHEPAALWKEQGLFDAATRTVFYPGRSGSYSLVRLSAPYDYLAPEVYDSAVRLNKILRRYRLQMVRADLNQVRSLELTLSNGTRLILGRNNERNHIDERLERFLQAAAQGEISLSELEYADLRYDSGFAIKPRVKAAEAEAQP